MAPLTRARANNPGRFPVPLMRDHYVQRASAGLILSEATAVKPMGVGYAHTPGIGSPEQVGGWKIVTKGVHEAGERIFLQLWHVGRRRDAHDMGDSNPLQTFSYVARELGKRRIAFICAREHAGGRGTL